MDALSTPASGLTLGGFLSTPGPPEPLLYRPPSTTTRAAPPPRSHLSHRQPRAPHLPLGSSPASARPLRPSPLPPATSRRSPWRRPAALHTKASTGYAAALLDSARCDGAVAAVERDVRRFSWVVRTALADPSVGDEGKGEAVRRAAEAGGFGRHLVALVRMLVGKGKVGMVGEVLEEFGRIHDDLTGTQAVLVSSEERMGMQQLAGIAEWVRRASGAAKVRVRHAYGCSS